MTNKYVTSTHTCCSSQRRNTGSRDMCSCSYRVTEETQNIRRRNIHQLTDIVSTPTHICCSSQRRNTGSRDMYSCLCRVTEETQNIRRGTKYQLYLIPTNTCRSSQCRNTGSRVMYSCLCRVTEETQNIRRKTSRYNCLLIPTFDDSYSTPTHISHVHRVASPPHMRYVFMFFCRVAVETQNIRRGNHIKVNYYYYYARLLLDDGTSRLLYFVTITFQASLSHITACKSPTAVPRSFFLTGPSKVASCIKTFT